MSYTSSTPDGKSGKTPASFNIDNSLTTKGLSDWFCCLTLESGNIPSVILKSDEQMAKEAEARAQQQQAQGMQEAALNMSEVIKNTGINNNA
jgi:hypothetical protein